MGWRSWGALGVLAGLVALNHGALLDALAYPRFVREARAILPEGWRSVSGADAAARLAALERAQTREARARSEATGALLRLDASGDVVLAVPMGLDSDILSLTTGCFRHARRTVNLIVWHFDISTGCI